MEGIVKIRNTLRDSANILDEFIQLKTKKDEGCDITKECEAVLGRFVIKMVELQDLQSKL